MSDFKEERCPGCHGARVQRDNKGLLNRCPACGGTGVWTLPEGPGEAGVTAPIVPTSPGQSPGMAIPNPAEVKPPEQPRFRWPNREHPTHHYDPNRVHVICGVEPRGPMIIPTAPGTMLYCGPGPRVGVN